MLHKDLLKAMEEVGIRELTEIQKVAIPKVLSGRHVLIVAPTGSGKTEAALLPIISGILSKGSKAKPIAALYITPLRALNRDMFLRIRRISRKLGINVAIRHGDTPSSARQLITKSPPHILITTPETLCYLLVNEKMRSHLRHVRWVVIDEYHELINSKRGAHLLADLERLRNIAGTFQRIALSASIGDVRLAAEALAPGKVVEIAQVPGVRKAEIKVVAPGKSEKGAVSKVDIIAELVREHGKVLIFTNTRDEAEWLGAKLSGMGIKVRVHHGSLSRHVREEVESELRSGLVEAVVATSSLELGIDVGHVNAVIQSSSPRQVNKFLQRIGRSLHRVGMVARGFVVTDFNGDDMLESLVIARRTKAGDLEAPRPYIGSKDVLAHVIVGMGLEGEGFTIRDVIDTLSRSFPYSSINEGEVLEIIELLTALKYLRYEGGKFRATTKGKIYYLRTTMIVDTVQYRVVDILTSRTIGRLDGDFVSLNINDGSSIVLSGRVWRVVGIDDEEKKVFVDQSVSEEASIPSWTGENIPVDYRVAREVCALRRLLALKYVPASVKELCNDQLMDYVTLLVGEHVRKGYPLPSDKAAVIEVVNDKHTLVVIHACLGSRGNRVLSYLVSSPFIKYLGVEPRIKVDPYRVFMELPYKVSFDVVKSLIKKAFYGSDVELTVKEGIRRSALMGSVAYKVLSRLGIMPKEAPPQVAKVLIRRYLEHDVVMSEVFNEIFVRHVDLQPLIELVSRIRDGRLQLKIIEVSSPSPLALEGMKISGGFDRVRTERLPRNIVAELVKRRLMSKKVRLYCMVCGASWESTAAQLPERIKCRKCGYSLVACHFGSDDLSDIVKRGLNAGRNYKFVLSGEERKIFEELLDSAELVLTYGKKAVLALAARGVGPKTARRIVGINDESEFFTRIYDAERTFLRTRRYWKD